MTSGGVRRPVVNLGLLPRARRSDGPTFSTKGGVMAVWALILLVGGLVGMLGAALIVAAIWEFTHLRVQRWEPLP